MLSYEWQGLDAAQQRIAKLASLDGLDAELEAGADPIVTEAQQEPPERPGQRYVRSHRLSGSWKRSEARRSAGMVEVDVTNPTEYGPFVQGEEQAWMHKGRWKTIRRIGEDKLPQIKARVLAWAHRTWRGG